MITSNNIFVTNKDMSTRRGLTHKFVRILEICVFQMVHGCTSFMNLSTSGELHHVTQILFSDQYSVWTYTGNKKRRVDHDFSGVVYFRYISCGDAMQSRLQIQDSGNQYNTWPEWLWFYFKNFNRVLLNVKNSLKQINSCGFLYPSFHLGLLNKWPVAADFAVKGYFCCQSL